MYLAFYHTLDSFKDCKYIYVTRKMNDLQILKLNPASGSLTSVLVKIIDTNQSFGV